MFVKHSAKLKQWFKAESIFLKNVIFIKVNFVIWIKKYIHCVGHLAGGRVKVLSFFPVWEGHLVCCCLLCSMPAGMAVKCLHCVVDLVIWSVCHQGLHVVLCTHEKQVVMASVLLFAEVENSLVWQKIRPWGNCWFWVQEIIDQHIEYKFSKWYVRVH